MTSPPRPAGPNGRTPPAPQTRPAPIRPATLWDDERGLLAALRAQVAAKLTEAAGLATDTDGRLTPEQRAALVPQLVAEVLDAHAHARMTAGRTMLGPEEESRWSRLLRDGLLGAGGLQALLDDPNVETINANGYDKVFLVLADGRRSIGPPIAGSDADLIELVRSLAAQSGGEERRFDRSSPYVSFQLPDGARLTATMAVSARPCVSVRRHRYQRLRLTDLLKTGTVDHALGAVLTAAVQARANILIAGAPAAGKTTLLRALAAAIPQTERIITIEDARELGLDVNGAHPDCVAWQAREPNLEGAGGITVADLFRLALRMSPDRVIVGEVRGVEVIPMLEAMSQGTNGSLATIHALSSKAVFLKVATYAARSSDYVGLEATNLLLASSVNLVVHLDKAPDGTRVVSSIREVLGADGTQVISNELFRPRADRRAVPAAPPSEELAERLVAAGLDLSVLDERDGWWPTP